MRLNMVDQNNPSKRWHRSGRGRPVVLALDAKDRQSPFSFQSDIIYDMSRCRGQLLVGIVMTIVKDNRDLCLHSRHE